MQGSESHFYRHFSNISHAEVYSLVSSLRLIFENDLWSLSFQIMTGLNVYAHGIEGKNDFEGILTS